MFFGCIALSGDTEQRGDKLHVSLRSHPLHSDVRRRMFASLRSSAERTLHRSALLLSARSTRLLA